MSTDAHNLAIAQALGELTGEVRALNQGLSARIADIRDDIVRLENSTNQRINGLENRVKNLEEEDKKLISSIAKLGVFSGGVGSVLTAAAIEFMKRMQ